MARVVLGNREGEEEERRGEVDAMPVPAKGQNRSHEMRKAFFLSPKGHGEKGGRGGGIAAQRFVPVQKARAAGKGLPQDAEAKEPPSQKKEKYQ